MDRLEHALNHASKNNRMDSRFIYVVSCLDFVKIGIAKRPRDRLNNMQVGCPLELKIIAEYLTHNPKQDERRLHDLLDKFLVRGEWFKIPDNLIAAMVKATSVEDLLTGKVVTWKQRPH